MCKWYKSNWNRIDPCMREFIKQLTIGGSITLACCCGHDRYSPTVVFQCQDKILAVAYRKDKDSQVAILPRKRRFYVRDSEGYLYIPEIDNEKVTLEAPQYVHDIIHKLGACNS